MPKFLFAYHGGKTPATKEEGERVMAAWTAWMGGLGAGLIEGGGPVGKSSTVSKSGIIDNGGGNPVSGYSVVEAPDHAAADVMAKGCPMVVDGSGSVEVAEILQM
jgi:hypothetical protein